MEKLEFGGPKKVCPFQNENKEKNNQKNNIQNNNKKFQVIDPDVKRLVPEASDKIVLGDGKVPIYRWDVKKWNPIFEGYKILILGGSGTGKSILLRYIMRELKDLIPVWTMVHGNEEQTGMYGKYFRNPGCVWCPKDDPDKGISFAESVNQVCRRVEYRQKQKVAKWLIPGSDPPKYKHNPAHFLGLDDISQDPKVYLDNVWGWIAKDSRQTLLTLVLILQSLVDLHKSRRRNFSHICSYWLPNESDRETLHKSYFSQFGTGTKGFKEFEKAFKICTTSSSPENGPNKKFRCIVANTQNPTGKIEEDIGWIEIDHPSKWGKFEVGADWWKDATEKWYNDQWKEQKMQAEKAKSEAEGIVPDFGPKNKKTKVKQKVEKSRPVEKEFVLLSDE